ncbi:helix-turn-helix domain-containing protein [Clostridium sp. B9]|uniref:helix-turn-helix domain-containing protein n=1 Tax=Clostridium sp. B9 TaxID=3423224 RepID=UPI003D2F3E7C
MTLGEKIRELRLSKKNTIKDLANFLGVTEQAVSQYERDIRIPNYSTLNSIANFFDIETIDLFPKDLVKNSIPCLVPLLNLIDIKISDDTDLKWNDIKGLTLEEVTELILFLDSLANKIINKRLSKKMNNEEIVVKKLIFPETKKSFTRVIIDNDLNIITNYFVGLNNNTLLNKVNDIWNDKGLTGALNLTIEDLKEEKETNITPLPKKEKQIWEEEGKEYLMPIASHDKDGNFTEEEYKHDDDLMNDEDIWK